MPDQMTVALLQTSLAALLAVRKGSAVDNRMRKRRAASQGSDCTQSQQYSETFGDPTVRCLVCIHGEVMITSLTGG